MTPPFLIRARRAYRCAAAQFIVGLLALEVLLAVLALWAFWIAP